MYGSSPLLFETVLSRQVCLCFFVLNMDLIELQVFCEDLNMILTLNLTREEADRATIDTLYLRELVNRHLAEHTPSFGTIEDATAMDTTEYPNNEENENSLFLWNTQCVLLLLNIYEDRMEEFKDGSKRHKKIWDEIGRKMKEVNEKYNVTGLQCQSKMNGLKRTYKKILDHNKISGNDRASWPFFNRMHEIFGVNGWAQPISLASSDPGVSAEATASTSNTQESPKPNKKDQFEKYFSEMKEERRVRAKEREEKKKERFAKFLEMKERQHKEKMKLIEHLMKK